MRLNKKNTGTMQYCSTMPKVYLLIAVDVWFDGRPIEVMFLEDMQHNVAEFR